MVVPRNMNVSTAATVLSMMMSRRAGLYSAGFLIPNYIASYYGLYQMKSDFNSTPFLNKHHDLRHHSCL